jgi:preprotein translocase subunit SecG
VLTKATAWLVVLFFVTSFSMALLVNKRSVVVDELDLAIPAAVETKAATVEEELPALDNTPPAATAPVEDDLPSLD